MKRIFICLTVVATFAFTASAAKPSAQEARAFVEKTEQDLLKVSIKAGRADWIKSNFITEDSEALSAEANADFIEATGKAVDDAMRFNGLTLPSDVARKIKLLKLSLVMPALKNAKEREEMTRLAASMDGAYGKGKYCPQGESKACLDLGALEEILATSRDPNQLKDAWVGWHKVSPPYRKTYARFVEIANKGAKEMGFKDLGAMWRSKYDLTPDEFATEMERLWQQVKPLYDSLYKYTRRKLNQKYGDAIVAKDGLIPAHLLGNMWSQEWSTIYPLLKPSGTADLGYDLSKILVDRKTTPQGLVRMAEGFFVSLGFEALPKTFWERSLFTKPADRDVVCHASAWDIDAVKDVRLKMCVNINEEDFVTAHHELGHNYYQLAYSDLDPTFRDSANDGFHEAIGDTIALSVTPAYLKELGFIDKTPDTEAEIGFLLQRALGKVAFLPFGYLVDQWRWKVSGEASEAQYNQAWWDLRAKYQGIAPPVPRSEADFDAGAKYHVPGNVPYARYFLAAILQFQFHRALCKEAGFTGPLHQCSIYGNKKAGAKLAATLRMGLSKPWPEALKAMTGEDKMDASAILDYFAPLKKWLDDQNAM